MATFRVKPSKPVAVMGAIAGAAVLVYVLTQTNLPDTGGFIWLWCAGLVGIVGFNLWAAFSKKGSLHTLTSDDDHEAPTSRPGTTTTRV